MLRPLSLRTRLVLGVLALAAVALIGADIATYTSLRSFLFDRTDKTLQATHGAVEAAFLRDHRQTLDPGTLGAVAPGLFVQIRSTDGDVLFSGGLSPAPGQQESATPQLPEQIDVPLPPAGRDDDGHGSAGGPGGPPGGAEADSPTFLTVPAAQGGGRFRVRASYEPALGAVLVTATSLRDVDSTLSRLLWIELLVTAVALAAIVLLGLWLVRLGLRPLAAMGRTADAIAAGDLSRRVERAEPRTEVGRLGLALNAMLGRIEASDRRLRRFVADASHELRTPLAAVRAYAELFERGASSRPDDLERAMRGIGRESERMSELVEDLLLLARLDEKRPLEREPVDLEQLVREAVETARALEPDRPIELAADPVHVTGDRARLRQVVDNLLSNVRAHTPPGTPARVRTGTAGGRAFVEVSDKGAGMSAEDADRVFERFYRADTSRSRQSGGVGLGLSIVAAITEAHGGAATVRSVPGHGTTFRIELPPAAGGQPGNSSAPTRVPEEATRA
jgi:two-component system OmpR family sensor kinase